MRIRTFFRHSEEKNGKKYDVKSPYTGTHCEKKKKFTGVILIAKKGI